VKNNEYWGEKLPGIDKVEFHIIPDASSLAKELCNGTVHFVPSFSDPTLFGQLSGASVCLEPKKGWNVFYLGFCADQSSPFAERRIRKAVAQAIDLSRICHDLRIGRALRGIRSPMAQPAKGPLPPGMMGYDRKIGQVSYAPEVAKIVLEDFTGEKSWRLVFNGAVALNKQLAEAIKENLEENLGQKGVEVRLEQKENFGDVVDAARRPEGSVMFLYSWHVSAPYPERILKPLFHSKSQDTNLTRYKSPVVDRLLDQAIQLRETALYSDIQQQIIEDVPMVFLYHSTRVAAYTRCKNLKLNVNAMPHDKLVGADVIP
jgi:peptide/nickel transport system substrate-binding protein